MSASGQLRGRLRAVCRGRRHNLPVRRGKARGEDGRWYWYVTWPDGTNTTWFPDDDQGGSELRVWRRGYDIKVGDDQPKQGDGGETLNVRFVLRR